MSTNRSPFTSRLTRKQNYQSANQPAPFQTHSPFRSSHLHPLEPSAYKKNLQQKQIEDLEQKVDLILEHNDKLAMENAELKKRLAQAELIGSQFMQKERISRYQMVEETEYTVRKLNSELLMKTRDLQNMALQYQSFKEASRKEIESMKEIIYQQNKAHDILKQDNSKLAQELRKYKEEAEQEARMISRDAERKLQEQLSKQAKEHAQAIQKEKTYQQKVIAELQNKMSEERNEMNNRKSSLINKLQETHTKQINQLREQLIEDFNKEVAKVTHEGEERCRQERDKADRYIRQFIQNLGPGNDSEIDTLRQEIKTLQQSLESRKRLIDELTSQDINRDEFTSNLKEAVVMKDRLKEQIQHMMRENEMLKIKMSEKYQKDLKQMVKIYDDKIEVLSNSVRDLSDQNDRLRHNYEDEVTLRIRVRRNAQIQVSQLKNLIRRLKIELQGVQDEFRLNIEGVRQQSASFSMALMKSMAQVKEKSTFHEEENRKLRMMYDKHELEVAREKKQAQQKAKYYESRLQYLNGMIDSERLELKEKEEILMKRLEQHENNLREAVKNQREHLQELTAQAEEQRDRNRKDFIDCKQKLSQAELDLKEARQQIERLNTRLKENAEHIERLRLELDMGGGQQGQKNQTLNNWKQHYEGIISKLEEDKKELKQMIDSQNSRAEQLTYKYRLLEEELKNATIALEKRGQLDTKIINLGLDQNLVKNMGEIWTRRSTESQSP